jgi:hypothetical protein
MGVPAPATRQELLRLLVAAGLVLAETSAEVTRYRPPARPPHVEEVLRLPDEQVTMIRRQDAFHRYTSFAADLAAVAVWSSSCTVSATLEELSHQLLATEEEIHGAIRFGAERGLFSTSGDEGMFTVMPRLPPPPEVGRKARRLE